jgi:hypothetical protein
MVEPEQVTADLVFGALDDEKERSVVAKQPKEALIKGPALRARGGGEIYGEPEESSASSGVGRRTSGSSAVIKVGSYRVQVQGWPWTGPVCCSRPIPGELAPDRLDWAS